MMLSLTKTIESYVLLAQSDVTAKQTVEQMIDDARARNADIAEINAYQRMLDDVSTEKTADTLAQYLSIHVFKIDDNARTDAMSNTIKDFMSDKDYSSIREFNNSDISELSKLLEYS